MRFIKSYRFVKELIEYLSIQKGDEVMIEILCRMLYKHGLIKRTDEMWVFDDETD